MVLRHREVARGIGNDSCRLRSGRGQATKPGGSPRSALSHPSGVFNRSGRSHPKYLQFGNARPASRHRRCEDTPATGIKTLETIDTDVWVARPPRVNASPARTFPTLAETNLS